MVLSCHNINDFFLCFVATIGLFWMHYMLFRHHSLYLKELLREDRVILFHEEVTAYYFICLGFKSQYWAQQVASDSCPKRPDSQLPTRQLFLSSWSCGGKINSLLRLLSFKIGRVKVNLHRQTLFELFPACHSGKSKVANILQGYSRPPYKCSCSLVLTQSKNKLLWFCHCYEQL